MPPHRTSSKGKGKGKGKGKEMEDDVKMNPVQPPDNIAELALRKSSLETQRRRAYDAAEKQIKGLLKHSPIFQAPHSLEHYKGIANKPTVLQKLQEDWDQVKHNIPVSDLSCRFVDSNNKLVAVYADTRELMQKESESEPPQPQPLEAQRNYGGKEENKTYIFDGIPRKLLLGYQQAVQEYCSKVQPSLTTSDKRHKELKPIHQWCDPETRKVCKERAGVHHLVHAWRAKGHGTTGAITPSKLVRGTTANALLAAGKYFKATGPVATYLGVLFQTAFPDEYKKHKQAFDAGKWTIEDVGPWMGRAIVYKLQCELHWDSGDAGPTAIFPLGQYEGGVLEVPQLQARLKYGPGAVFLAYAEAFAHIIRPWTTTASDPLTGCTPGRIGNVFFTRNDIREDLCEKEPGWGRRTGYGTY